MAIPRAADALKTPPCRANLRDYATCTPSYILDTLGMTAMTFAIGAIGY